ncbi:MAG: hypothetical protein U9R25_17185 [Chloroflexota bacterium]|nr:hypothetical protein [Chloroflexota bacterium]
MDNVLARVQRRDFILRVLLLLTALFLALIFANMAASLFGVYKMPAGVPIDGPWGALLGSDQVTRGSDLLALLGVAFLGGASLSCLVFFLERVFKAGWRFLQDVTRK